jgi:hypothetical protein
VTTAREKAKANAIKVNTPDLYELRGAELHVTYSTTSFDGTARFTYQDATKVLSFVGDQIRTVDTGVGTLVTVTLCMTVDTGSTTFTLLVPTINLGPSNQSLINTVGITTIHRFSIVPAFNQGQTELYNITPLTGIASFVQF